MSGGVNHQAREPHVPEKKHNLEGLPIGDAKLQHRERAIGIAGAWECDAIAFFSGKRPGGKFNAAIGVGLKRCVGLRASVAGGLWSRV